MGTVSVIEGILMAHGQLKGRTSTGEWRFARCVQARMGRPPKRTKKGAEAVSSASA